MVFSARKPISQLSECESSETTQKLFDFRGSLKGHEGVITCLSANHRGLLASGGREGTYLWDVNTLTQLHSPAGAGVRAATSAVTWADLRESSETELLFFGTQLGYLVCWSRKKDEENFGEEFAHILAHCAEVTSIQFDRPSSRLALCNRGGLVVVFTVGPNFDLDCVFSRTIVEPVSELKALAFGNQDADTRCVMVFGMTDGRVITIRGTGEVERTKDLGCTIGDAVVSTKQLSYFVHLPAEGVALYDLKTDRRDYTFFLKRTKPQARPHKICYIEEMDFLLCGTDSGEIHVFNTRTRESIGVITLPVPWAQVIAATRIGSSVAILAASGRDADDANRIYLWVRKDQPEERVVVKEVDRSRRWSPATIMVAVLALAMTAVVLYQNVLSPRYGGTVRDKEFTAIRVPQADFQGPVPQHLDLRAQSTKEGRAIQGAV
ncbi:WD40-repeat-containing domain protein [Mycena pura]|uniref:WD40-repeat-containing domain protein n=1 Tax=Mycena pura TaxID=153505 RepID=A0AAD6UTR3_9AGAR|nr:WD40-repeat-containing domain protein [Mycena pura]